MHFYYQAFILGFHESTELIALYPEKPETILLVGSTDFQNFFQSNH